MNKFLMAFMAVLCILLTSCNKEEFSFEEPQTYEVESRSASIITVGYVDTHGNTQSVTCEEASITYVSSTSVELVFTYSNGSTHTKTGDDITITTPSQKLKVRSGTSTFLAADFELEACNTQCCYAYNNGTNVGTGLNFIVEEEAGGF